METSLLICTANQCTGFYMITASAMKELSRPYSFKLFKGCLPQNLLSPLLNTLSYIRIKI